jgi:hypothetical protein
MAFLLIGCTTVRQKAEIDYVKSIPVFFNTEVPLEERCYIATKEYSYIFAINDVDRPRDAIHRNEMVTLIPGIHQLTVQYNDGNKISDMLRVVFNFEEGQNYYLDYEITELEGLFSPDSIRFFLTKLTDERVLEEPDDGKIAALASIEKVKAYLAFSDANPAHVAGTWYYENSYPPFNNKITFQKDRFTITSFNRWGKSETITSGRYVFNNETIILIYEKKQDKDFFAREVLYYELENEFLNILDAPQSAAILTVGSLKGKYHKTN